MVYIGIFYSLTLAWTEKCSLFFFLNEFLMFFFFSHDIVMYYALYDAMQKLDEIYLKGGRGSPFLYLQFIQRYICTCNYLNMIWVEVAIFFNLKILYHCVNEIQ